MDVGLRNAGLNFRQQEPTHIMENIVYNELLSRGYNVDASIVDVFAKNSEGKRAHKLNSLRNIPDSFKKIIVVNGTKKPWRNEEGFVIMGMKYFELCTVPE